MDYTICHGFPTDVQSQVRLLLSDKWRLAGDLIPMGNNMVCQAMVLEKWNKPKAPKLSNQRLGRG